MRDRHSLDILAHLQSLKTQASKSVLIDAMAERSQAALILQNCDTQANAAARAIETLLLEERFDLDGWRIGCAALSRWDEDRKLAAERDRDAGEQEQTRRQAWHRESRLEDRSRSLVRDAAKRATAKRDDAAATEAASLTILRKGEVVP